MTLSIAVQEIEQEWRFRYVAAVELLELIDRELADMQAMVDRIGQPL